VWFWKGTRASSCRVSTDCARGVCVPVWQGRRTLGVAGGVCRARSGLQRRDALSHSCVVGACLGRAAHGRGPRRDVRCEACNTGKARAGEAAGAPRTDCAEDSVGALRRERSRAPCLSADLTRAERAVVARVVKRRTARAEPHTPGSPASRQRRANPDPGGRSRLFPVAGVAQARGSVAAGCRGRAAEGSRTPLQGAHHGVQTAATRPADEALGLRRRCGLRERIRTSCGLGSAHRARGKATRAHASESANAGRCSRHAPSTSAWRSRRGPRGRTVCVTARDAALRWDRLLPSQSTRRGSPGRPVRVVGARHDGTVFVRNVVRPPTPRPAAQSGGCAHGFWCPAGRSVEIP